MNKVLKVISAIVALAGIAAAVYFAVQKFIGKKEPEYFDDNDFFECDNDIDIIEVENLATELFETEDDEIVVEEAKKEEPAKKSAPKKASNKKAAKKETK